VEDILEDCKNCRVDCIRKIRDDLLKESDKLFLSDAVIDDDEFNAIQIHRQERREYMNKTWS
jgi:hypothetical protein